MPTPLIVQKYGGPLRAPARRGPPPPRPRGAPQRPPPVWMALLALGWPAISLPGAQAGIRTDTSHGRARIANVDPARVRREIGAGKIVIVAGFQGATAEGHAAGR